MIENATARVEGRRSRWASSPPSRPGTRDDPDDIKVPPALLAGNTVIVKPAPTTPLTTLKLGELVQDILPPGVVNVIVDHNDLGSDITNHPDVRQDQLHRLHRDRQEGDGQRAPTLKRLTLELGGNDAAIVLDDVDPKEAAPRMFAAAMQNPGQACIAIKRIYVHESSTTPSCDELGGSRRRRSSATAGAGHADGPLQNKAQFEKVKGFLEEPGERQDRRRRRRRWSEGLFHPADHRPRHPRRRQAGREEQFGPVLPVLRYSDIDDAIAPCQRHGLRPGRLGLVVGPRAGSGWRPGSIPARSG